MKYFTIILYLFISHWSYSQEFLNLKDDKTVSTIAYWSTGESRTYHIIKKETKNRHGRAPISSATEYDITIKVKKETPTNLILVMSFDNYSSSLADQVPGLSFAFIGKIYENLSIIYQTNELGQFEEILNKKELVKNLESCMASINKELKSAYPEFSSKEFTEMINNISKVFLTEENINSLYSEDIQLVHGNFGAEFSLDKPEEYEIDYPTLSEKVLTGVRKIQLVSINKENDSFNFTSNEFPDELQLQEYLTEIMGMFVPADKIDEVGVDEMVYESGTSGNYSFELSTGWPIKIEIKNQLKVGLKETVSSATKEYSIVQVN